MRETYSRMVKEYEEAINIVSQRISKRRAELKNLPPCGKRTGILRSEIAVLYEERREAMDAAKILREYAEAN